MESNNAQLTYSNDPQINDETGTIGGPPVEVKIYTGKIQILKVDSESANANKLQDAKFVLKKNDGGVIKYFKQDAATKVVTWVENIADATVEIAGLDTETRAMTGTIQATSENGEIVSVEF